MSKYQREKGKRLEREAATLLSCIWPKVRRSANQAGGAIQPDIDGCDFWIEVSGGKRPNIMAKLRQAEKDLDDSGDPRQPLVCTKRDRGSWTITMRALDFIELVQRLEDTSQCDCKATGAAESGSECHGANCWCKSAQNRSEGFSADGACAMTGGTK